MISIKELIEVKDIINDLKIHFATGPNNDYYEPLKKFENNEFDEWQKNQSKKNFTTNYLVSFITYDKDLWLFAGVYQVLEDPKYIDEYKYYYYDKIIRLQNGFDLVGRLIVEYKKIARQSYRYAAKVIDDIKLYSISEDKIISYEFPGYKNVMISFNELKIFIKKQEKTWKTALSNSKGVYAITDHNTGKIYIGSATGLDCFWQRWLNYSDTGHGGNKKLKQIIKEKGFDYTDNFYFSIIEHFTIDIPDNYIIERESYWKNVFAARKYGYNEN